MLDPFAHATGAGLLSTSFPAPVIRPAVSTAQLSRNLTQARGSNLPGNHYAAMPIKHSTDYWRDLRAGLHDLCGIPWCPCGQGDKHLLLTDDQQHAIDAIQTCREVGLCGGTGTGKSHILGNAALIFTAVTLDSKGLFGGPKMEQTCKLSWLELQRAHRQFAAWCTAKGGSPGDLPGVTDWYPQGKATRPEWFASAMALNAADAAAAVKGMMHAPGGVYACLEEVNGIDPVVMDAIDGGLGQANAHLWFSFNPVSEQDAAGRRWGRLPAAARVTFNALDAAEWQARHGVAIPGMPSREVLAEKWAGRENDPLYYTNVLGQFPPQSADWVIVPQNWYDRCTECVPAPGQYDLSRGVVLGLDTAGGSAENVIASCRGRIVKIEWVNREQHQTPKLMAAVREVAARYGAARLPLAVDYVGLGGKGVGDDLAALGWTVLPFIGGGREFAGRTDPSELAGDLATWAWWTVRELTRRTVEAIDAGRTERYISFPRDPVLREQLARRFTVNREKRYQLVSKDELEVSPDRADAVAMAVLAANLYAVPRQVRTTAQVRPQIDDRELAGDVGGWLNGEANG